MASSNSLNTIHAVNLEFSKFKEFMLIRVMLLELNFPPEENLQLSHNIKDIKIHIRIQSNNDNEYQEKFTNHP